MIMQSHLESAVSNTTSFSHTLTHTHNTTLSLALFTHTVTCDQWFRRFSLQLQHTCKCTSL